MKEAYDQQLEAQNFWALEQEVIIHLSKTLFSPCIWNVVGP